MEETQKQNLFACARFDDELPAHLEGESRPFVVSHAHDCVSCGALLADLDSLRQTAHDLPLEEPSAMLWARIHKQLEAEGALAVAACAQFGDELEAYLEGEAHPFVVTHADECEPCGAVLADLQSIQLAAGELPQEEPSPALWGNLRARMEADGIIASPACRQFDEELQAFLEGETRPFVAGHARECTACRATLADLKFIQMAARELPWEEPSPAVWANVRARLDAAGAFPPAASGWRQLIGWRLVPHAIPLGVMAALVFLGSVLTLPTQRWNPTDEGAGAKPAEQLALMLPAGEDRALAHVVSDLERNFKAREASMAPDLKATYDKSLVSLDGSIRECLDSLRHEPRNTLAHDYLLTAYTRKAEVLSSALEFEGR